MSGIKISQTACKGCKKCLKSCANQAIYMQDKLAVINQEACILCGLCIDACPFKAISIEKDQLNIDNSDSKGIWVFVEQNKGSILNVAYELLGKGRELADQLGEPLIAVFLAEDASSKSDLLFAYGADQVIICSDQKLAENKEDIYTNILEQLYYQYKPAIILYGATGFGRSLAPKLAARLQTGLTADCTILEIKDQLLQQTRPAFGGNLMATIVCPNHRPQMATVRPGVMPAKEPDFKNGGQVINFPFPANLSSELQIIQELAIISDSIADAQIIIAAGRGIGNQKNMQLINKLAETLGGVIGCSRPLVDMGWCEYKYQIGQTGCSVKPKLLITCGISGAIQHLAGISNAEKIIAINSDPNAPIFNVADYKLVGDCVEIIKSLLTTLNQEQ